MTNHSREVEEECKGFGADDIKVETSAMLTEGTDRYHLPAIEKARGPPFIDSDSKLDNDDCTVDNEELGDSTVD